MNATKNEPGKCLKASKDQPSEMHKMKDFSDEFGGGDTERLFLESRVFFRGFELETA